MAVVRRSRTIDAPPGAVFMWVADYRNAPSFVEGLEPLRPVGGSSFEASYRLGPKRYTATISLVEVEVDRRVTWAMSGGESRSLTFLLAEAGAGTQVTIEVSYERPSGLTGAVVGPIVDDAVSDRAEAALEAIRTALG